jgi:hypothetical protein
MAYGVCSSLGQYQVVVQDVLQRICTVHHHNLFSMAYLQLGSSGTLLIVLRKLIAIQMWCLHANFASKCGSSGTNKKHNHLLC